MFTRIWYHTHRFTTFAFLAVMPLGFELTEEKPGELMIGVGGGTGQVVTVVRDCSGSALRSTGHPLNEISASAQYSRLISEGTTLVIGVRGGQVYVERKFSSVDQYGVPDERSHDLEFTYYNPHISLEGRSAGLGMGYVGGDVPALFDGDDQQIPYSAHIRLGSADAKYLLIALNENQPLLTSGGPFNLGMGYRASPRVRGLTGVSAMFYDGLGFAQQIEIQLSKAVLLDLGFRVGGSDGKFEGGASIGFRYRIPTR